MATVYEVRAPVVKSGKCCEVRATVYEVRAQQYAQCIITK